MPDWTAAQWLLAIIGAASIGIGKSGFAGAGLVQVLIFANLFETRASTGVVLPMLIAGDIGSLIAFHQHARWAYVRRMLPPACIGVIIGWALMQRIDPGAFKPLIGSIILALTALQIVRMRWPEAFLHVPHARWFAWTIGIFAGITTMLANAAGPIMALYFLAVALPKLEFVGTSAWYFLIVNSFKVPFSAQLGLIHGSSLLLNLLLVPAIALGLLTGRWLVKRVPQRVFDGLLLAFAGTAALRLIGAF